MNINNIVKFFFTTLILFFLFSVGVKAQYSSGDNLSNSFSKNLKAGSLTMGYESFNPETPEEIVGIIISSVLSFLGIIFIAFIIYGGVMWMTAEGNDEQVKKAQKIIKQATIGLIVVLVSYSLSWLILNIFISKKLETI